MKYSIRRYNACEISSPASGISCESFQLRHEQGCIKVERSKIPRLESLKWILAGGRRIISQRFSASHREELHVGVYTPILNAFPHIDEEYFNLIFGPTQCEKGLVRPAS